MKIGIDIGGSHIAMGIINEYGKILEKYETRITSKEKEDITQYIEKYIIDNTKEWKTKYEIGQIGIGIPGTVSNDTIVKAHGLGIENYSIVNILQEALDIPIKIRNDAKCAALAEDKYGCLKQYNRSLFITLGTGIGGAILINHKLLDTGDKPGCEIGHMIIQKDGKTCKCGRKGCWQQYASMKTLKNKIRTELGYDEKTNGKELLKIITNQKLEKQKQEKIEIILKEYITNLSIGIINLINIFEPEVIGIGGSFVFYKEILQERLKKEILKTNQLYNPRKNIIIESAKLENDAGIIGSVI